MIRDLKIVYLSCINEASVVEEKYPKNFSANGMKDLVRLLMEKEMDLLVVSDPKTPLNKLKKVVATYQLPVIFLNTVAVNWSKESYTYKSISSSQELLTAIAGLESDIIKCRAIRERKVMEYVLEGTTRFTSSVIHTSKDLFISETKSYFSKFFKLERCFWVEVKSASAKLPPILKLRQELIKQKVDQRELISVLDNCSLEIAHSDNYQIWKTSSGEYLTLIWIQQDENLSQCIVLNRIQFKSRDHFQGVVEALGPFLKRRWDLCLTVQGMQHEIYKDSLTDLYNQKFLGEVVEKKIEEYHRYKTPFSILFIDVDHFKKVNDSMGHLVGSGVLKDVGELLMEEIRTSDFAFRYGGDEFIVLLAHTEGADAEYVAERIRQRVENCTFCVNGAEVNITVSIGLAFFPTHATSAVDIIRIADEAMYYGKNKSRNIVYKAS